jgi:hypothetical protein
MASASKASSLEDEWAAKAEDHALRKEVRARDGKSEGSLFEDDVAVISGGRLTGVVGIGHDSNA